ncbi:MAG TPA: hypothetical protein VM658_07505, partial [bacterium]|nr:hypothetical protein [bacterium]
TGAPSKKHSHPSPLKIVLKNNPWRSWRLGGSPVRLFWTALRKFESFPLIAYHNQSAHPLSFSWAGHGK